MRTQIRLTLPFLALPFVAAVTGCGDDEEKETGNDVEEVSVSFSAVVGSEPFACGSTYDGIGTADTTIEPTDLRFYVYDVVLLDDEGNEYPVTLTDDDFWQNERTALLDFEDKTGGCANGTEATNTVVVGSAAAGEYTGIRFGVGVPFEQNHQDASVAEAPLSSTALFWNWQGGYKFIRFEASNGTDTGYRLHLGSTGCGPSMTEVTECARPNRPEVTLTGFDPTSEPIVLDLEALLATSDVSFNTPETAAGCMGAPDDPECSPVFGTLGIDMANGAPTGAQSAFHTP